MTSKKKPIIVCEECGRKTNTYGVEIGLGPKAYKVVNRTVSEHEDEPVRIRLVPKGRKLVIDFPDFSSQYIR